MVAVKNLRQVNLNTLPVLREILRQGSITKAAAMLHITPPALSNTLRQMRGYFGDELIVRNGRDMVLTPRARKLLLGLETALTSIEDALFERHFDALLSEDKFHIAMTDHSMALLSAPLTLLLASEAPLVQISFTAISRTIVPDFNSGKIDMVLTPRAQLGYGHFDAQALSTIQTETLCFEPMVCIGRADDAELAGGISREKYLQRPHVGYYQNSEPHTSIEQVQLFALGLKQNNRLLISSYMQIPHLVAETGCLAIVPRSIGVYASRFLPIQLANSPIEFPEFELAMVWHENNEAKASMAWLRSILKRCIAQTNLDHDLKLTFPV